MLWLLGCALQGGETDVEDTDTDVAEAWPECAGFEGTEPDWPACRVDLVPCDGEWPEAPGQEGLLVADVDYYPNDALELVVYEWTDATAWDAFRTVWPPNAEPLPDVDFATQTVVGVRDYFGSYCADRWVDLHGIQDGRLYVRFHDSYGIGCELSCDIDGALWVIYAVPRDAVPEVCVQERNTCDGL